MHLSSEIAVTYFSPLPLQLSKVSQFIQRCLPAATADAVCCCCLKKTGFWWHCSIRVYTAFLLMDLGCDLCFKLWLGKSRICGVVKIICVVVVIIRICCVQICKIVGLWRGFVTELRVLSSCSFVRWWSVVRVFWMLLENVGEKWILKRIMKCNSGG